MLNKICFVIVGALTFTAPTAFAAETASSACIDISVPKGVVAAANGRWIELTNEQLQFLRGIYAMNPQTPPGLPFGDKAVLARVDGNEGGLVFFIDGDRACTPMTLPHEVLAMMEDVATAKINHEAGGL
jgi:hypothetical protein